MTLTSRAPCALRTAPRAHGGTSLCLCKVYQQVKQSGGGGGPSVEPLPLQVVVQMDARSGWWGASGLYGGFGGWKGVGFST